ncbi:restriction endonuclease subunit S [Candidatus Poseidoniaceae archaeon]|nr:restriction endonuclease subunit S [Candidatus Poseidoniaceae archaeon]
MASASAIIPVGYKQTEVGVIPDDWDVRILSESVIHHQSGIFKDKTEYGSGINIVGVADIYDIESIDGQEFNLVNLSKSEINQYTLKENDLLYNESSLVKEGIARTVFVSKNGEGTVFAWHTRKFSVDPKRVFSPYLYFYLQSKPARRFLESVCIQTALTGINTVQYFRCPLILPSIREQQVIAEAITAFSNSVSSLEALIEKKRDIKQGTMQELLTGKTRLPGFSGKWILKTLDEIGEITGAGVDKKIIEGETPVRLVNYLDVYNRSFIYSNELNHHVTAPASKATRCCVRKGDVFFTPSSEVRDDIAVSAIAMEDILDATYSYHVVRLRIDDGWDLNFRAYAFQTKSFLDQAAVLSDGSGTRYVISLPNFRKLKVLVPAKPEQRAIGQVLSDMDAEIAALEQRLEKTKAIKQGMMQQLLTGRIRLVDPSTLGEASA